MKNIHVLPTDKDSKLYLGNLGKPVTIQSTSAQFKKPLHIYITNNEEIKEGVNQWYLDKFINKPRNSSGSQYGEKQDVIILTTDKDLIKDGVQEIDDEFLEWFVNNSSCDSVKIDLVPVNEFGSEITVGGYGFDKFKYKIIIPKEEPKPIHEQIIDAVGGEDRFKEIAGLKRKQENCCTPIGQIKRYKDCVGCDRKPKQETLEEMANKWVFETNGYKWSNNDDTAGDNYGSFVAGYKESLKTMYSEEEVRKISLDFFYHWWNSKGTNTEQGFDKWFEKIKKK
jgi:hypothetical protein